MRYLLTNRRPGDSKEDELTATLTSLLAPVFRRIDHPWHKVIREQVREVSYRKIVDSLQIKSLEGIAVRNIRDVLSW